MQKYLAFPGHVFRSLFVEQQTGRLFIVYEVKIRFPLYMLWDLVLTSYVINSLPVCCSTNKLLIKPSIFAYVITRKRSKNQRQKYRAAFFYYIEDHTQKFKPFRENFFFHPNCHLAWFCTHPFNYYG